MNLLNRSTLRVLACAIALVASASINATTNAAPPDSTPGQKAHAHRGHHRHLNKRQKARLRHAMKHHRHHAGGKHAQAKGKNAPKAN